MSYGIHGVKRTDGKAGSLAKSALDYEHDRERLLGMLEDLLWYDLDFDALIQLDNYTLNRRDRPDNRVTKFLIEKGLLAEDGTRKFLPVTVNLTENGVMFFKNI